MNKLLIPTILAAVVLVAGFFALSPIEQASTVHTTILAQVATTTVVTDFDLDATAEDHVMIADSAAIKEGHLCVEITDTGNDGTWNLEYDLTADGTVTGELSVAGTMEAGADVCTNFVAYRVFIPDDATATNAVVDFTASYTSVTP